MRLQAPVRSLHRPAVALRAIVFWAAAASDTLCPGHVTCGATARTSISPDIPGQSRNSTSPLANRRSSLRFRSISDRLRAQPDSSSLARYPALNSAAFGWTPENSRQLLCLQTIFTSRRYGATASVSTSHRDRSSGESISRPGTFRHLQGYRRRPGSRMAPALKRDSGHRWVSPATAVRSTWRTPAISASARLIQPPVRLLKSQGRRRFLQSRTVSVKAQPSAGLLGSLMTAHPYLSRTRTAFGA